MDRFRPHSPAQPMAVTQTPMAGSRASTLACLIFAGVAMLYFGHGDVGSRVGGLQSESAFVLAGGAPRMQPEQRRMMAPLQADPNQWGMIRPVEKKKPPRKPPFVAPHLLNKITRQNKEGIKETIQLWGGYHIIIPAMIGHTIAVHNGRDFIPVSITEGMVGYRLKDFISTHTFKGHPKQAKVTKYRNKKR